MQAGRVPGLAKSGLCVSRGDVLDLLLGLVDKSLVLAEDGDGEVRFRFLETIREYAREKLEQSGETATGRAAHPAYFATLVRGPAPQAIEVPGQRNGRAAA
jgi:predicted ATPase